MTYCYLVCRSRHCNTEAFILHILLFRVCVYHDALQPCAYAYPDILPPLTPYDILSTGSTLELAIPNWGLQPNRPLQLKVKKNQVLMPVADTADLSFQFTTSWTAYTDAQPAAIGSAGGGETLTMVGAGFALNVSYGRDDDFVCKFEAAGVHPALFSEPVRPISPTAVACVTPRWGDVHVATFVSVSLLKGLYTLPQPAAAVSTYEFVPSWHDWSSSVGAVSGGEMLTITGVGFNTSQLHRCKFLYNKGQMIAFSEPVLPESKKLIICVTPVWKSWRDAATRLVLLSGEAPSSPTAQAVSGMREVLQMRTAARQYLNATFQFLPGFIVSSKEMVLMAPGDVGRVSLRPDTKLDGELHVTLASNDSSVATVTSPYAWSATMDAASMSKEVSVTHVGPGVAYVTIESSGAPYGYAYRDLIRVICKGSLLAAPTSTRGQAQGSTLQVEAIVLQRDETEEFRLSTDVDLAATSAAAATSLFLGLSLQHATLAHAGTSAPVASVYPDNVTLTGVNGSTSALVRVTCRNTGRATLVMTAADLSGEAARLYKGVSKEISVLCRPGIVVAFAAASGQLGAGTPTPSFVQNMVRVQPMEVLELSVGLDVLPTVRTELHILNSRPELAHMPSTIVMPAFTARPRVLRVDNLRGSSGETVLTIRATSPGMLERMNEGCSGAEARQCAALFRDLAHVRCSFLGWNATSGDERWSRTMANLSGVAGAGVDCSRPEYRDCYRSACCASHEALECAAAAQRAGCRTDLIVPPLADAPEDAAADFGVPAASVEQEKALYLSWVPGVNCQPHLACAWARCFPGKGNYENVESHPLTIRTLPGFRMEPPFLALQQGADQQASIILDLAPTSRVTVRLSVISVGSLRDPVAMIVPSELTFEPGHTQSSVPITLKWMAAGRASMRITTQFAEQPDAGAYSNVTQVLPLVLSLSPGFVYSSQDTSVVSGFQTLQPGDFPVLSSQTQCDRSSRSSHSARRSGSSGRRG